MSSAPQIPDLPAVDDLRDRFSRYVAVGMVVAILATAVVTYWLTAAARAADAAGVRAQQLAVEAMAATLGSQQSAQVNYEAFAEAQEQVRLSSNALQEQVFAKSSDRARLTIEAARARNVAARLYQISSIRPDGPEGPEQDPMFPVRLFANAQRESVRLAALQDAATEASGTWQDRVARYTAILTIFAAVLYLLGSSLTIPQKRSAFLVVGVTLLGAGVLWAGATAAHSPRQAPDHAAEEYATGVVSLRTAIDSSDYRRARDHFSRAIELRPSFARAYAKRAIATFYADSPQTVIFATLSSPQALTSSVADLRQARTRGLKSDVVVIGTLGGAELFLGLQEHRSDLVAESIRDTRDAIELDPDHPGFRYNLALALLARGDLAAARAAYTDAVRYTMSADGDAGGHADDFGLQEQFVASALTDLEVLRTTYPGRDSDVQAMKQFIVGAVSRGRLGGADTTNASVTKTKADVYASQVQVSEMRAIGFDPSRDVLSVQWYYATPGGRWAVLPEVSGTMDPQKSPDGTYFVLSPYLSATVPPRCLDPGQYRAEIYVNGRLVDEASAEGSGPLLQAASARELRFALCHPPTWRRADRSLLGVRETYLGPGRDQGVSILRIAAPARYGRLPPKRRSAAVVDATLERFSSDLPSQPTFDENGDDSYFLGLDGSLTRWYRFRGGRAFVGAGIDDDGTVVIGLVFGPHSYFKSDEPYRIFDSMLTL
jgi:tetratricopeptide (TPR) repeat protein